MQVRSLTCFPLLLLACSACTATEHAPVYAITLEQQTGAILQNPHLCNDDIKNGGGDLVESGIRYRGKCNGAGLPPSIQSAGNTRYLKFATDPTFQGSSNSDRTRTELALTSKWFPFEEPVYIGFNLRIPGGVDITDDFFYLMQFWQCDGASPIAGVRLRRGHSHTINFMTRGDARDASMATFDLTPDAWTSFVIKAAVDPSGNNGSFMVWDSPDGKPSVFDGPYGYSAGGKCGDRKQSSQQFRLKFGIYKGTEPNRRHEVDFDNIRIGGSFDAVSPWKQGR